MLPGVSRLAFSTNHRVITSRSSTSAELIGNNCNKINIATAIPDKITSLSTCQADIAGERTSTPFLVAVQVKAACDSGLCCRLTIVSLGWRVLMRQEKTRPQGRVLRRSPQLRSLLHLRRVGYQARQMRCKFPCILSADAFLMSMSI